jgi:hypothetical protein
VRPRAALQPRPRSVLLDEDAPEVWVFLDYQDDGRVLVLTRQQYESRYRPAPDEQG